MDIRWITAQLIHCFVKPTGVVNGFCCSFVYAFNNAGDREKLWVEFMEIADNMYVP